MGATTCMVEYLTLLGASITSGTVIISLPGVSERRLETSTWARGTKFLLIDCLGGETLFP